MGDVLAVLPFQNTLSTFNITGAGIVAALENGVSQVEEGGRPLPAGGGPALHLGPEASRRRQGRIRTVEVQEGDAWVPIDPDKVYAVATNNFMRNGGDGYAVLRDEAHQRLRLRAGARGGAGGLPGRSPRLFDRAAGADHQARMTGRLERRQTAPPQAAPVTTPAAAPCRSRGSRRSTASTSAMVTSATLPCPSLI